MKQERIMELLQEAAKPGCSTGERSKLWFLLRSAALHLPQSAADSAAVSYQQAAVRILDHVLVNTIMDRPDQLVSLFPLFAALCGDTSDITDLAQIDWSLIPKTAP